MKKISHSAWKRYLTCPKQYELHYKKRLRPKKTSSALLFGTAVDAGLNCLLLEGDLDKALDEFRNHLPPFNDDVMYDDRDIDYRLLPANWQEKIDNTPVKVAWACLRVKGRLFLEAYYNEVYPLIEEVEYVQKELDERPGFIDAVLRLRGIGRVLVDHKTSASFYKPDSVKSDTQLAVYADEFGIEKAAFIVMVKNINLNTTKTCKTCKYDGTGRQHKTCPNEINGKRCHGLWDEQHEPKATIQVLIDDIPKCNKELVSRSISEVEDGIKKGYFPENLTSCGKQYGKPCPYINYCWNNDDSELEYKEKK